MKKFGFQITVFPFRALRLFIFLSAIIFSGSLVQFGAEEGLSTLPMLRRPGSPLLTALGGGGLVMGSNSYSAIGNPALAAFQDYTEMALSYEMMPFGASSQNLIFTKPTRFGTLGFDFRFSGQAEVPVIDDNFLQTTVPAYDALASLIYGVHFADFNFGLKTSIIHSQLGDFVGRTVSFDSSFIFYFDTPGLFAKAKNLNLGVGVIIKNLSPGIRYAEILNALPMYYGGAVYYNIANFSYFDANFEVFTGYYQKTQLEYGTALEINVKNYLKFRTALTYVQPAGSGGGNLQFSGGGSLLLDIAGYVYDIAYSFEPSTELESRHNIGLRIQMGGGGQLPFGIQFTDELQKHNEKKTVAIDKDEKYKDSEDEGLTTEDLQILALLRWGIGVHSEKRGRFPADLNELLIFLNDYGIYEIPNPIRGSYRYNKRTGKIFIRY